jgi:hypothetical protein
MPPYILFAMVVVGGPSMGSSSSSFFPLTALSMYQAASIRWQTLLYILFATVVKSGPPPKGPSSPSIYLPLMTPIMYQAAPPRQKDQDNQNP